MPQASEIAWLIPVFPLIGAVLSGLGLISINKKINNSFIILYLKIDQNLIYYKFHQPQYSALMINYHLN